MESGESVNESRIGTLIEGKYNVVRLLGEGGMGSVYEAENTWTGRRVAVKVLRRDMVTKKDVVVRFMFEAKASTQINHPNIVEVLDMGEEPDGSLYIIQEFLDGTDLGRLLDQRRVLSPREALDVAVPIMGALVAAHRRGIIHRDIKPDNIFLVRTQGKIIPKLIDFGVSKVIDQGGDKRSTTQTGTAVGTPNYMSPEQARGDATVDGRCDVWAMGVVLYEMLTGRCPFDAPNYNLLIVKIIMEAPPRIEQFAPGIPPELANIVHHALEPDRDKRYGSMRAFLSALLECHGIDQSGPALSVQHHESLGDMDASEITMLDASAVETFDGDTPLAVPTAAKVVHPPPSIRPASSFRPQAPAHDAPVSIFRALSLPPPPRVPVILEDDATATQEFVQLSLPTAAAAPPPALIDDDTRATTPGHISPVILEKQPSVRPEAVTRQPPRWLIAGFAVALAGLASVVGAWVAHSSTPPRPRVVVTTASYLDPLPSPAPPVAPAPPVLVVPAAPVIPVVAAPIVATVDAGAPTRTPSHHTPSSHGTPSAPVAPRTSANGALILSP